MSFKNFYKEQILNEGKWWSKFKEDQVFTVEANGRTYKACKMEETNGGPAYVLESRGGHRYGLFRANDGFTVIKMNPKKKTEKGSVKSNKKYLVKVKGGAFKENEGKLIFEADKVCDICKSSKCTCEKIEEKAIEDTATTPPCKEISANGTDNYNDNKNSYIKGIHTGAKAPNRE